MQVTIDQDKMKRNFNAAKKWAIVGFSFWLSETIAFLFIYGWHLKAIGIEHYFDGAAVIMIMVASGKYIECLNELIKGFKNAK